MASDASLSQLSCKCLNIKILPSPRASTSSRPPSDDGFQWVYVGEDGLLIEHAPATLRTRLKPRENSGHWEQYTSLTCILCGTLGYRVLAEVDPLSHPTEGVVIYEEALENDTDVLRSKDGWLEVFTGQSGMVSSVPANHSQPFSVVINHQLSELPLGTSEPYPSPSGPSLPPLPALFPPPPFTPSHHVFNYFAKIALRTSDELRSRAADEITKFVAEKIHEIEQRETELRRDVQSLWITWNKGRDELGPKSAAKDTEGSHSVSRSAVTDFVPEPAANFVPSSSRTPASTQASSSRASTSLLSASLRQSSFHYPRAASPATPSSSGSPSPSILSITQKPGSLELGGFPRSFNPRADEILSKHYMSSDQETHKTAAQPPRPENLAKSAPRPVPKLSEPLKKSSVKSGRSVPDRPVLATRTGSETGSDSGKGKRKVVTFDSQPAVVTIKRELASEAREKAAAEQAIHEEPMFDMDGAEAEEYSNEPLVLEAPVKPLLNGTPSIPNGARAMSLPGARFFPTSSRATALASSLRPAGAGPLKRPAPLTSSRPTNLPSPKRELNPDQEKLLKLVAADMPSHRTAWKENGRAWELFDGRRNGQKARSRIEEEDDEFDDGFEHENGSMHTNPLGLPASLPVNIGPPQFRTGSVLREPKAVPSDHIGSLVPPIRAPPTYSTTPDQFDPPLSPIMRRHSYTSSAGRKAMYASRDLSRSMDPGPSLMLAPALEEEDQTDSEDAFPLNRQQPGRGQQLALRILQKQHELPPEGMWRSLA